MIDYEAFITRKSTQALHAASLQVSLDELNPKLYRFQKDIVRWALAKGRGGGSLPTAGSARPRSSSNGQARSSRHRAAWC